MGEAWEASIYRRQVGFFGGCLRWSCRHGPLIGRNQPASACPITARGRRAHRSVTGIIVGPLHFRSFKPSSRILGASGIFVVSARFSRLLHYNHHDASCRQSSPVNARQTRSHNVYLRARFVLRGPHPRR